MAPHQPLNPDARAQVKRWLENWKRVGPILEAERWKALAALTDEEAQQATLDLLNFWQPSWKGDDGEELLLHQRVLPSMTENRLLKAAREVLSCLEAVHVPCCLIRSPGRSSLG